jgi:hypothetical protein
MSKPRGHDIGRAISILIRQEAAEIAMHADVDAFYAPSECHALVARGAVGRRRQAQRHAAAVAGLPRREVWREFSRRTSPKAARRAYERAIWQLCARMVP